MTAVRGYAETAYGQLHYAETGTGPVLLLLHQTPRSHDEFREVQPLLATGRRVIAMDMLGFGMSAPLAAPQTIERIADGTFALLDALGVADAAVLGHHTGGVVAIEMAARRPERVRALVLSCTPWTDPDAGHPDDPPVDVATPADNGDHLITLWSLRRPYYPAGRPDLLDRFIRDALAPGVDPAEGHRACARYRMADRAGLVTAPVLLLAGAADPFSLPALPVLGERLTNAAAIESRVLDGGVPLMEEAPDAVAAAVDAFLRTSEAAGRLRDAAATRVTCPPVRDLLGDSDVALAYAVQRRLTTARLAAGARLTGWKIGLTSPAVQRQLGVDRPDFGVLFADMDVSTLDEVPSGRLLQPKAEAEIAFVLGADLDGELDPATVRAAVEYAVPALEIVDSRIAGWDITITDTVADNASSGLYVLGEERLPLDKLEPAEVIMRLFVDGEQVSRGSGAACLGDPLNALLWLARMARELGEPLRAGQVVLSGALGPMVPAVPGTTVRAELDLLGSVSATFSRESA